MIVKLVHALHRRRALLFLLCTGHSLLLGAHLGIAIGTELSGTFESRIILVYRDNPSI